MNELSEEEMLKLLPYIPDALLTAEAEARGKLKAFTEERRRLESELRTARSVASESVRYRNRMQRRYELACVQCNEAADGVQALHARIWSAARGKRAQVTRCGRKGGAR